MTWKTSKNLFLLKKSNTSYCSLIFLLSVPKGINSCLFWFWFFFCLKKEVGLTFSTESGSIRKESILSGVFMALCTSVGLWDPQHKSRNGCFQLSVLLCVYISLRWKSPLAKGHLTWQWLREECSQKFRC